MAETAREHVAHLVGRLGSGQGVEIEVAQTERPWELDLDAIVVSVGWTLGSLGEAMRRQFPTVDWEGIDFGAIKAQTPQLLTLSGDRNSLRFAVLASTHPDGPNSEPSLDAVATATRQALELAARAGAGVVGLSLLGTGQLRLPREEVARIEMRTVAEHVARERWPIQRIVFVGRDDDLHDVLRRAVEDVSGSAEEIQVQFREPRIPGKRTDFPELPTELADLAGGVSRDLVDPTQGIPLTEDRLGFTPYVSMLATVIADRKTPPPLSVGVFAPWGSGKSFFMGLLRRQVDDLATSGDDTYHSNIAQIGFNAWHYADSNLWASLGDEIFRQLAGQRDDIADRRARLRAERAQGQEQRKALEDATARARDTAAALRAEVDEAVLRRRTTARDLVAVVGESAAVRRRLRRIWSYLGIQDAAEQGEILAGEVRTSVSRMDGLRKSARDRRGRLALGLAVVLLVVFGVAALVAPAVREWVAGAGAGALVVLGYGAFVVGRTRAGLRELHALSRDLRRGLEKRAEDGLGGKLAELRAAEAAETIAKAQLADVVERVGRLGRELSELEPGARLYAFLAERAASDSYASRLGLVSTIRKDFQHLAELLKDLNAAPRHGAEQRPVERIVLYIDDLDRCSPAQVVQVLEAVHLLLALELFVVVVGVDPRWLLRSLSTHYSAVLAEGPDSARHDRVLPEDYLEKIINIPLILPGMAAGGLRELLRSILEDDGQVAETAVELETRTEPVEVPVQTTDADGSLIDVQPGSEASRQDPRSVASVVARPLTQKEVDVLAALDHLVGTPRQAKRLFNLYRMVRATRDLSDVSDFLGAAGEHGQYQVVALLLGVVTGYPREFGPLLEAPPERGRAGGLLHRSPDAGTLEFLEDLQPKQSDDGAWWNGIVGPLTASERRRWSALYDGVRAVSPLAAAVGLSDLQLWAPRIRRFSYVLTEQPSS